MGWETNDRERPKDWKRRAANVLRDHNRLCHWCGHGGADVADHVIPRARGGTHDMANLRPIHGDACPTCGVRCHNVKTNAEAIEGRRLSPKWSSAKRKPPKHPGLL